MSATFCESSPSVQSHLYSPSTRWTNSRNRVLSNYHTATSSYQNSLSFETLTIFPSGVASEHHPTCLLSTTKEGASVAEGLPEEVNAIGDSRKNDRDRNTLLTGNSSRVHSPFPANFGYQPIKLELYLLVHTYTANYVRVHSRLLGVYKESRVAYRAIRVRVS